VLALGGALGYNLVPYLMLIPYRLDSRPEHQRFWAPALNYLATHSSVDYRVEVVETAAHWESYWFPRAGFPLVRGWYRQLDVARNPVLFESGASASAYRAWLHRVGSRYVVLPHTRLDPLVGSREARLVRASKLRLVLATPTVSIYEVAHPTPILTGPAGARLTRLSPGTIAGTLAAAGTYRLRIATTPYMRVQIGAICLEEAGEGLTTLVAREAGPFELTVPENPLALIDPSGGRAADC
jgi:hypothetical protein